MKVVYQWWSLLVFAAVVIQVGLAGYGAFFVVDKTDNGGVANEDTISNGFDPHVAWGYLGVGGSFLVFLVIGLIAGVGKWRLGRHGVLFGLWFLQVALAIGGYGTAWVGFFHPVNALVIFTVAGATAYSAWQTIRAPAAETTAVPSSA